MDLGTDYLGLGLRNPIIASASPLTGDMSAIRLLEDSGAGAVVLPSLFEEQIRQEELQANEHRRRKLAGSKLVFSRRAGTSPITSFWPGDLVEGP
jgi:dihydroorotate dehydrogenase